MTEIRLFGVRVHRVTMEQAVDAIVGFFGSGRPHHVVTADTSMLVMAQRDAELREIINRADLVTPDSFGVLWAAKRLGCPIAERVTGVDVVARLCEVCARAGRRVYFFGSAPGVADDAAARLAERFPGLQVAGTRDGFFKPEEEDAIAAGIAASRADLVIVALGIPKQEKWIARHLHQLGPAVAIGVGGSLDVYSGRVQRAPAWVQRLNAEWLYRLAKNPRKIGKVKTLPVLVGMTFAALLRGRRGETCDGG